MTSAVAFLGLGAMGAPMAERLLQADFEVRAFDVSPAAVAAIAARGAKGCASVLEALEGASIAVACLPSPEVSRAVALGPGGVVEARSLQAYVEMSTIGSPAIEHISDGLGAQGVAVIDAPVSGGPRGARAGTLSAMVAGTPEALALARPVLDAIAGRVFVVGNRPGLAQVAKAANNMISAAGMVAAFEAASLAVKAGLDARTFIDAVNASTGRNSATLDKFPASILPRSFDYGGKVSTMAKDVALCLEEARRRGVPMWIGAAVGQMWLHALAEGRGDDDYTTLIQMIEGWAGVTVGDPPST